MDTEEALTERQNEIAIMIAQGLGNKEIAFRLGIRESTVKNHVTEAFRRSGYRNRVELAVRYAHLQNLGAGI